LGDHKEDSQPTERKANPARQAEVRMGASGDAGTAHRAREAVAGGSTALGSSKSYLGSPRPERRLMNARAASSPYIFSGLLKCGLCGNNFTLVSGTARSCRSGRYGCPFQAARGICKNSRLVARDVLEKDLLAKLQRDVLSDAAVDDVLDRVGQDIGKRFAALGGEMEGMRRRKKDPESELTNLSRVWTEWTR
jgi:hypothetical protein